MLSIYIDAATMDDQGGFADEVAQYVDFVLSSNPADPAKPVMVPGDPERATEAERRANGIPLSDEAWASIQEAAALVGINDADFAATAGL